MSLNITNQAIPVYTYSTEYILSIKTSVWILLNCVFYTCIYCSLVTKHYSSDPFDLVPIIWPMFHTLYVEAAFKTQLSLRFSTKGLHYTAALRKFENCKNLVCRVYRKRLKKTPCNKEHPHTL